MNDEYVNYEDYRDADGELVHVDDDDYAGDEGDFSAGRDVK